MSWGTDCRSVFSIRVNPVEGFALMDLANKLYDGSSPHHLQRKNKKPGLKKQCLF
jgi:hypothetical protein